VTDADFDELVAESRAGWIAAAGSLCRLIDWHSVSDRETIHVLDAATLPPTASEHTLAWTAAGSDNLLRPYLRDRRAGPVLVLDAGKIVRSRLVPETLTSDEAYVLGRLEVCQVALHELGHARLAATRGSAIPQGTTVALLVASVVSTSTDEHRRRSHDFGWSRAYVHASDRAARSLWPRGWWLDACRHDLRLHGHEQADSIVEALKPELGSDEPLTDILRREPPAAFSALFSHETPPA
jgi:hypothetical protein